MAFSSTEWFKWDFSVFKKQNENFFKSLGYCEQMMSPVEQHGEVITFTKGNI